MALLKGNDFSKQESASEIARPSPNQSRRIYLNKNNDLSKIIASLQFEIIIFIASKNHC